MQASTVVIAAGERSIEAVLAAEALRRAARQQRVELAIEIRSDQGVTGALPDAQAAAATQLLLVGGRRGGQRPLRQCPDRARRPR